MIELNRYELKFEPAFSYFQNSIDNANFLSSQLMQLVNFKNGQFFTLLPENVDEKKLYEFCYGGIAWGEAKSVKDEIIFFIQDKLCSQSNLSCIFDSVNETFNPDSEYNDPLYLNCGMSYKEEIYYLISRDSISLQNIEECFYISNAIWHSLCILSEAIIIHKKNKMLSLDEIRSVCLNSKSILITAYDAEGYIFWERNK